MELPPQLLTKTKLYIQESDSILAKKSELADLKEGDTVEHKILGRGTILKIDRTAATYTVKFENVATPRKMSFKAPLTPVVE